MGQNIRIVISSSKNGEIDKVVKFIKDVAVKTNGFISGPVCFKGSKLIDYYNLDSTAINALIKFKENKAVGIEINILN